MFPRPPVPPSQPRQPSDCPMPQFQQAPSGAVREAISAKIPTHLVPYELITAAAVGLNYGAEKYAPRNFELGLPLSVHLNSIDRHTRALMAGEVVDGESGIPHVFLLASSIAMLAHNYMQGVCAQDIPPKTVQQACVSDLARSAQMHAQQAANIRG